MSSNKDRTDFGFQDIPSQLKEKMVKDVFSKVANKYDVMNDLMSAGTHRLWKDELIRMMGLRAAARTEPNYIPRHIDVAGGTGDIAFRSAIEIEKSYSYFVNDEPPPEGRQVVVCDINPDMLQVGRSRAKSVLKNNVNMVGIYNMAAFSNTQSNCDVYRLVLWKATPNNFPFPITPSTYTPLGSVYEMLPTRM
jgi:ubiquinone/menaquinone biosynthesis C-methylase UbiE